MLNVYFNDGKPASERSAAGSLLTHVLFQPRWDTTRRKSKNLELGGDPKQQLRPEAAIFVPKEVKIESSFVLPLKFSDNLTVPSPRERVLPPYEASQLVENHLNPFGIVRGGTSDAFHCCLVR
jgi:hypothetical protein